MAATERSVANGGHWQTYLKLPQFPERIGPALPLSTYSFGFFPGSVILEVSGEVPHGTNVRLLSLAGEFGRIRISLLPWVRQDLDHLAVALGSHGGLHLRPQVSATPHPAAPCGPPPC